MLRDLCRSSVGVWTLTALVVGLSSLHAGDKDDPVKITHKASKADAAGKQTVTLTLDIAKGWYIYANPVGDENFEPNKVQVKAKGAAIKVHYPAGKVKTETLLGKEIKYNIHKGQVAIKAELQRTDNAGPVEMTIQYNACNDKGQCLAPIKKKIKID